VSPTGVSVEPVERLAALYWHELVLPKK